MPKLKVCPPSGTFLSSGVLDRSVPNKSLQSETSGVTPGRRDVVIPNTRLITLDGLFTSSDCFLDKSFTMTSVLKVSPLFDPSSVCSANLASKNIIGVVLRDRDNIIVECWALILRP
ncbi:hypothetical protein RRG08_060946 [Elysia crispata]|uniref:Uncharacterized protein n=1 Tax=Elysia crispata TaxID=231223 RepID=A0AAE1AV07_9GAST|nr:hypothetical protein RRG08_060946 [Elysia crispata]